LVNNKSSSANGDCSQFKEAKNSVLSFCSASQTTLGTLLIGYAVALFTLFELFKDLGNGGLAARFQMDIKISWLNWFVGNSYVKFILLFAGALLLTTYIVRTVHRFAAYNGITNYILYMETCPKIEGRSFHYSILNKAYNDMKAEKRRAFLLRFNWFVTGDENNETQKSKTKKSSGEKLRVNISETTIGWLLSGVIAFVLVIGLLTVLW